MSERNLYAEGARAAWLEILREAVRHLHHFDAPEGDAERWRIERDETVGALRRICRGHGDNDWNDELHLADVIEKHLERHLEAV